MSQPIKPFWTDYGIAIVLWCVYNVSHEVPRCYAAFSDFADADHYCGRMQALNPRYKYEIRGE